MSGIAVIDCARCCGGHGLLRMQWEPHHDHQSDSLVLPRDFNRCGQQRIHYAGVQLLGCKMHGARDGCPSLHCH